MFDSVIKSTIEPGKNWQLRWNPDPARDGIKAFGGLEEDRAGGHPGAKHIYPEGNSYRFDMHLADRDSDVKQRTEAKDMKTPSGENVRMLENETWRLAWSCFIPDTLDATERFTAIFQFKVMSIGGPPLTIRLQRRGGTRTMELEGDAGPRLEETAIPFEPFQGKWFHVQIEALVSHQGYVKWWVWNDAGEKMTELNGEGLDLWRDINWLRPKWGIYRSLGSEGLQETHLLIQNYRAYQLA